jgi:methylated-DNA-[protein]-cysteine S-methyltransferase
MTYHIIFATRFGHASLIYRQKPFAAIKIFLPLKDRESLVEAVETVECGDPGSHDKAVIVKNLIIDYFKGKPIQPPWKWMDMDGFTKLQQSVLVATADIPYGELRSYKDIAKTVNLPRAYRFVGTTLANNPFPILIPCHRVIRSDASFGQFGGGTDLKRKLIEMEARYL